MSYILEAIKKSDLKRKLGSVPDVHTVHDGPLPAARRLLFPYILAFALLVNAILIVLWLHPWSPDVVSCDNVVTEDVIVEKVAAPPDNTKVMVKEQAIRDDTPVGSQENEARLDEVVPPTVLHPVSVIVADSVLSESARVVASVAKLPLVEQENIRPLAKENSVRSGKADVSQDIGVSNDDMSGGENDVVAESLHESPERSMVVERIGGQSLPDVGLQERELLIEQREAETQRLAKVPFLHQMSADFQKGIPEIHISFLSYSYQPAKRLVSINGRIYREGRGIQNGLQLEKITPGGVVLSYKKRLFKVNI